MNFRYDGTWRPGPSIVIEDNVYIGSNSEFNICDHINIGKDVLIASGCKFIDHNHGYHLTNQKIRLQPPDIGAIKIEDDVWLGVNVVVLKGVTIGCGAIVAAGSVVTTSIPSMEIWGGIPAKKISNRNDENLNNHMRLSGTF
ncbi:acyltransferase [Zunongwangia sp. HRR-M8]|uniref:acyltransferase n=1 Tax=Zunongwangia sp. HRR-M8 TaxID=3015170 RepID=UPI0022DCEF1B|nr:acyltransferase [Zunongwangia sp. HRR-M8]WBL21658.1 acyltransferase [Zunongwangia sp. HRR-M8]